MESVHSNHPLQSYPSFLPRFECGFPQSLSRSAAGWRKSIWIQIDRDAVIGRTRTAAGEDGSKWQGVHVAVVSWCNTGLEVELVYKFRLQNPNLAVSRCAKCLYRLVSILCSRVSRLSWKAPRLQMRNFPEAWMANNGAEIEPKLRQDVRRTCFFQVGQGRVFAAMCHAEPCRVSEKDQTCQVCTFIAD